MELSLDSAAFEPDRTYVFAFGGSIVDLHESNSAEDLKWAFSTGSALDTLRVRGRVIDRMSRSGKADLRVLLYRSEIPWDSIWSGRRPDALGQTNSSGGFSLEYLSPGTYKGVAFDDANGNYRWDAGEYVALDTVEFSAGALELAWLGNETPEQKGPVRISTCKLDTTGMMRVAVPKDEDVLESWYVLISDSLHSAMAERDGDSVMVWSSAALEASAEEMRLVWTHGNRADTARVRLNSGAVTGSFSPRVEPPIRSVPQAERSWKYDRAVFIEDPTKMRVTKDSVYVDAAVFSASTEDEWTRSLTLKLEEDYDASYALQFLPGVLNMHGIGVNEDTLMSIWATHSASYFGNCPSPLPMCLCRLVPLGSTDSTFNQIRPWSFLSWLQGKRMDLSGCQSGFDWQSAEPYALQSAEPYFCPAEQPEIRSNWLVEWQWSMAENETEE